MTGSDIIGALLREHQPLINVVPLANIKAGMLPEGQPLPALLVRTVSLVDRQPLKRGGWCRSVARIAVTVRAASYRDQGAIIALVRDCCRGRIGDIGGGTRVSILTAGLGPDVIGPGNSFEQTQDFRVSFDAEE
ncbi:MAG TPA: hypothetical protein VIR65_14770 [Rhizorhapis sp.]